MVRRTISLLFAMVVGLFAYGLASYCALWLAIYGALTVAHFVRLSDPFLYALGFVFTGAFAGGLAEVVGIIGNVRPPWRRRWTVGVAIVMWILGAWMAVSLWLHPPIS